MAFQIPCFKVPAKKPNPFNVENIPHFKWQNLGKDMEVIGQGAFGGVFVASHTVNSSASEVVVVKKLLQGRDDEAKQAFVKEARFLHGLV